MLLFVVLICLIVDMYFNKWGVLFDLILRQIDVKFKKVFVY